MNAATRRLLIALKSPIQKQVDDRPRCEECGSVLTRRDFTSYWDDETPEGLLSTHAGRMTAEERKAAITPRICEDCAEKHT